MSKPVFHNETACRAPRVETRITESLAAAKLAQFIIKVKVNGESIIVWAEPFNRISTVKIILRGALEALNGEGEGHQRCQKEKEQHCPERNIWDNAFHLVERKMKP